MELALQGFPVLVGGVQGRLKLLLSLLQLEHLPLSHGFLPLERRLRLPQPGLQLLDLPQHGLVLPLHLRNRLLVARHLGAHARHLRLNLLLLLLDVPVPRQQLLHREHPAHPRLGVLIPLHPAQLPIPLGRDLKHVVGVEPHARERQVVGATVQRRLEPVGHRVARQHRLCELQDLAQISLLPPRFTRHTHRGLGPLGPDACVAAPR
mmetsp:Transcript_36621/g.93531  ORF Transcript_36621/g.93531 Transcript_36621/m.93531 type:complete len:207 (-) Transcript_36621:191-811(-)